MEQREVKKCWCECGYTCAQECDLDYLECFEQHFVSRCGHNFRGLWDCKPYGEQIICGVTCKRCGMLAAVHDIEVGLWGKKNQAGGAGREGASNLPAPN